MDFCTINNTNYLSLLYSRLDVVYAKQEEGWCSVLYPYSD